MQVIGINKHTVLCISKSQIHHHNQLKPNDKPQEDKYKKQIKQMPLQMDQQ